MIKLTSKQRAFLMSLASKETAILQIGKNNLTPELTASVEEAFSTRELIKISVLQNSSDDRMAMAQTLAERTHSTLVQVIGKKIVLYRENPDLNQIQLP